jgi:hypothetical protein
MVGSKSCLDKERFECEIITNRRLKRELSRSAPNPVGDNVKIDSKEWIEEVVPLEICKYD